MLFRSVPYVSALFHLSSNIWSALDAAVSSEGCSISSAGLHLVYQHCYYRQEFSVAFCCAVAKCFVFRRFKAGSFRSLGPGLCNTSYIHSYKWFSIIQWSFRRSACSRWYICRIFFLQRRLHHIVRSGKHPFCRSSCPHRVLNSFVHVFSVITVLYVFHSPRPL